MRITGPNVFEIILPTSIFHELSIRPIETAFGMTKEKYLFYNDIILGVETPIEEYHNVLEISNTGYFAIYLIYGSLFENIVKFDIQKPDFELFLDTLRKFINEFSGWKLIFEHDCEQYEMLEIIDNTKNREKSFNSISNYFNEDNENNKAFILSNE